MTMKIAAGTCFLLAGLIVLFAGLLRPAYNWDVIGYVGAANALTSGDTLMVHASTYEAIGRGEGTRQYAQPSPTDTPYRVLMRSSPAAFAQTLRFYKVRIAYVFLVAGLSRLGMESVFATQFISAVCALLGVGLLFVIARRFLPFGRSLLLLPLAFMFGLAETAGMSTPDAMACAITLAAVYLFLSERSALLLVLPLLVAVRTDLLLLALLMCASLWSRWRSRRILVALSCVSAVAAYVALNSVADYPGWRSAFIFTFIDRLAAPGMGNLGVREYLLALARGAWGALGSTPFLLFTVFALAGLSTILVRWEGKERASLVRDPMVHLGAIAVLFVVMRMAVFPLPDARYFVGPYLCTSIAVLALGVRRPGEQASTADPRTTGGWSVRWGRMGGT